MKKMLLSSIIFLLGCQSEPLKVNWSFIETKDGVKACTDAPDIILIDKKLRECKK